MFPDVKFINNFCQIEAGSILYIFSDGVYEIHQPNGDIWGLDAFIELLKGCKNGKVSNLDLVMQEVQAVNLKDAFDDDLSILEIAFD